MGVFTLAAATDAYVATDFQQTQIIDGHADWYITNQLSKETNNALNTFILTRTSHHHSDYFIYGLDALNLEREKRLWQLTDKTRRGNPSIRPRPSEQRRYCALGHKQVSGLFA